MRKTLLTLLVATLAGALWSNTAKAAATCVTLEKMKEITKELGASVVFQGTAADSIEYVVYGQPETGEWIALRLSAKPPAACVMAYGMGFGTLTPKDEPKK